MPPLKDAAAQFSGACGMKIEAGQTLSGIDRCPQCGISHPLLEYQSHFYENNVNKSPVGVWITYRCSACMDIVAAKVLAQKEYIGSTFSAYLITRPLAAAAIVPNPIQVDEDIPERPRRYLQQAVASLQAPDGAIMLAGSAIDAMLKLKGYTAGSVYTRINKAVEDHILTQDMSDWAHAVRLESNKPRHADITEPHGTPELAKQTIAFAMALGDFLFALPAKIARGKVESEAAVSAALDGENGS